MELLLTFDAINHLTRYSIIKSPSQTRMSCEHRVGTIPPQLFKNTTVCLSYKNRKLDH